MVAAELGQDGYVDSNGVKISLRDDGERRTVHPDSWVSRLLVHVASQMPELAKHFQVVAIDQRGYNLSDKPDGVENYRLEKLVGM